MQIQFSAIPRFGTTQPSMSRSAEMVSQTPETPRFGRTQPSVRQRLLLTLGGFVLVGLGLFGSQQAETRGSQARAVKTLATATTKISVKNPMDTQSLEAHFREFTALIQQKTSVPGQATAADWQVVQEATVRMATDPQGRLKLGNLIKEAQAIQDTSNYQEPLEKLIDHWLANIRLYTGEAGQGAVSNVAHDINQFFQQAEGHTNYFLLVPSILAFLSGAVLAHKNLNFKPEQQQTEPDPTQKEP